MYNFSTKKRPTMLLSLQHLWPKVYHLICLSKIFNAFVWVCPLPGSLQMKLKLEWRKRDHLQNQTSGEVFKKPLVCASSMIFIGMMHTSKPAQGKVVDSCQFHGVWRCLVQLGSSSVKTAILVLPAPSPGPWAPSPSQHVSRRVERFHLTMEMGLPSLPASFWADLKVCIPELENLPYPKSRLKPTAAFQALPGNPAIDTHTCTLFDIKKSLELFSRSPNMKTTLFTQPFNFISLSHQLVFSCQKVLFKLLTNLIKFMRETHLTGDKTLCTADKNSAQAFLQFFPPLHLAHNEPVWCLNKVKR